MAETIREPVWNTAMAESGPNPQDTSAPQGQGAAPDAEAALAAAQAAVSNLQQNVDAEKSGSAAAEAMRAAMSQVRGTPTPPPAEPAPFEPESFDRPAKTQTTAGIDLLSDVNLNVKIELGRTRMLVEDVLKLSEGAVVELDKLAGDPVDVYVNERHIARGEVLVLNDNFCVRINEILPQGGEPGGG